MTKEQLIEIIKDNDEKEYIEFKANYLLRGHERFKDIFIKCEMCEESGHGVPKVVGAYGEDAYEFMNHFIDVTIPIR